MRRLLASSSPSSSVVRDCLSSSASSRAVVGAGRLRTLATSAGKPDEAKKVVPTPQQAQNLEDFVYRAMKRDPEVRSRAEPFLKQELGPLYKGKETWRYQAGQRAADAKLKAGKLDPEAEADVTHYVVDHPPPDVSEVHPRDLAKFAVIPLAGTQFKVTVGDTLTVNRLDLEINEVLTIDEVLLTGNRFRSVVGRPFVPGAKVTGTVQLQLQEDKVLAFHKRAKTNSQRLRGSRRQVTVLRIDEIEDAILDAPVTPDPKPGVAPPNQTIALEPKPSLRPPPRFERLRPKHFVEPPR